MATKAKLPSRLHHTAYVSRDLEATRKFYEDIIGLPLVATWCEMDKLFGAERTYCHCFFGLGDGGALAFFQFADQGDQELFGPKMPFSPFHHIALNVDKRDAGRASRSASRPPATRSRRPSCSSTAIAARCTSPIPNGMICEFTLDHPDVEKINATRSARRTPSSSAGSAGDHTSNNTYR